MGAIIYLFTCSIFTYTKATPYSTACYGKCTLLRLQYFTHMLTSERISPEGSISISKIVVHISLQGNVCNKVLNKMYDRFSFCANYYLLQHVSFVTSGN